MTLSAEVLPETAKKDCSHPAFPRLLPPLSGKVCRTNPRNPPSNPCRKRIFSAAEGARLAPGTAQRNRTVLHPLFPASTLQAA
jgi:hypothetical protein